MANATGANDSPRRVRAGRLHDIGGGLVVRRMLPVLDTRRVGPFVFFDHIGPVTFAAGQGMDVRPHPHIGLATVTWLFDGAVRHRDSLGNRLDIRPGEVNWMTAGKGIAHSERTPPEERRAGHALHGIQVWVALPLADAEMEPEFHHHERPALPRLRQPGVDAVVIAGAAHGATSPVKVFAPMFFIELRMEAGATYELPAGDVERGVHVVEGELEWGGLALHAHEMGVQGGTSAPPLRASTPVLAMVFGGAPLDGDRRVWWNFVAGTRERIEQAKADWRAQRFGRVYDDEDEFIPLPE